MPRGKINTVPGNVTYTPSSYLNTFVINVRTHMASGNINSVPLKTNLYTQWLLECSCNQNTYICAHGYINTVPGNINPHAQWLSQYICPVALLKSFLEI